jgi:hypothetical protein
VLEAAGALAEGVAQGLKKDGAEKAVDEGVFRKQCQLVFFAYDDHYRFIAEAIGRTALPAETKTALGAHFPKAILVDWPNGKAGPGLPARAIEALVAALPAETRPEGIAAAVAPEGERAKAALTQTYGAALEPKPEGLEKWMGDLRHKDSKTAWAAVDELAKLGPPAIPHLVRLLDWERQPLNFRAAGALGKMGKAAACALPDLHRASLRGGISEMDSTISAMAIEAIASIEKGETK